eukprot:356874-Chlamydomonas_euryale.AAC.6
MVGTGGVNAVLVRHDLPARQRQAMQQRQLSRQGYKILGRGASNARGSTQFAAVGDSAGSGAAADSSELK